MRENTKIFLHNYELVLLIFILVINIILILTFVGILTNITGVLIREEKRDTERDTQGEHHVMMEAEIEVSQLRDKEHQGLPATTRR